MENVEVPTVSQSSQLPLLNPTPAHIVQDTLEDQGSREEHSVVPDNQEMVPDDEEHVNKLPSQMAQMRLNSNDSGDSVSNKFVLTVG